MHNLKYFFAAFLIFGSQSATADPIRFDWTNNGNTDVLLEGSGYFLIDEADISEGFANRAAKIFEFAFSWRTTEGNFASSSANGDQVVDRGFLTFNDALELIGFDVCFSTDGVCDAKTSFPLIRITGKFWGATSGEPPSNANFVFETPQKMTASTVTTVPEPGTLALLGLGLLGFGARKRKRA